MMNKKGGEFMENVQSVDLLEVLKSTYQGVDRPRDPDAIREAIEPLLVGVTEGEREALGRRLWGEFYRRFETEGPRDPYSYTGLATVLAGIPLSGS